MASTQRLRYLILSFGFVMSMVSAAHGFCPEGAFQALIVDNQTGGDCSLMGQWDFVTKTCSLDKDITCATGIFINGEGLTLDGNNYSITGQGTYNGVTIYASNNVTVKNAVINGYTTGVYVAGPSSGTKVINNVLFNNNQTQYTWNTGSGILMYQANDSHIAENQIQSNGYGIWMLNSSNNKVLKNKFVDNVASVNDANAYQNTYSSDLPTGGNYWSRYDSEEEGCSDVDIDGICDQEFYVYLPNFWTGEYDYFQGVIDYMPWKNLDDGDDTGNDQGPAGNLVLIEDFISIVENMVSLKKIKSEGIAKSLIKSMENAAADVKRGRMNAAARKVDAVIHKINAQAGKKITSTAASELLEKVGGLVHNLGN